MESVDVVEVRLLAGPVVDCRRVRVICQVEVRELLFGLQVFLIVRLLGVEVIVVHRRDPLLLVDVLFNDLAVFQFELDALGAELLDFNVLLFDYLQVLSNGGLRLHNVLSVHCQPRFKRIHFLIVLHDLLSLLAYQLLLFSDLGEEQLVLHLQFLYGLFSLAGLVRGAAHARV